MSTSEQCYAALIRYGEIIGMLAFIGLALWYIKS